MQVRARGRPGSCTQPRLTCHRLAQAQQSQVMAFINGARSRHRKRTIGPAQHQILSIKIVRRAQCLIAGREQNGTAQDPAITGLQPDIAGAHGRQQLADRLCLSRRKGGEFRRSRARLPKCGQQTKQQARQSWQIIPPQFCCWLANWAGVFLEKRPAPQQSRALTRCQ